MGEYRSERQPEQEHLEAVLRNVDTVDGIDVSFLVTRMGPQRFRDALSAIADKYKAATGRDLRVDLTFAINDPEITKNYRDKKSFLRALKGLLDNSSTRKHIARVTVKGPKGTKGIEPNVFESDIRFEETDV